MQTRRVAIVVPCYNESTRLPVKEFEEFLARHSYQFVFVNDGSRDNTLDVLQALEAKHKGSVWVIDSRVNRGKAESVRHGINFALSQNAEFVGFWDADLATPLDVIPEFVKLLEQHPGVNMVFGARVKLLGRQIARRTFRHYAGRVFATVVSLVLQLPVYDTQCGAKMFRAVPEIQQIFTAPFSSRWVFDVEFIARYIVVTGSSSSAAEHIFESPLPRWVDVRGSRLKPTDFFVAFWDVLRIYWKYMR